MGRLLATMLTNIVFDYAYGHYIARYRLDIPKWWPRVGRHEFWINLRDIFMSESVVESQITCAVRRMDIAYDMFTVMGQGKWNDHMFFGSMMSVSYYPLCKCSPSAMEGGQFEGSKVRVSPIRQ